MLFYYDDVQSWIPAVCEGATCYEGGKVYDLDRAPTDEQVKDRFKPFVEPPGSRLVPFAKLVETCDALIDWMNGPDARKLDWEVPKDYHVRDLVHSGVYRTKNHPVSASELVRRSIRLLHEIATSRTSRLPFEKKNLDEVDCLETAVRWVTRLRDRVQEIQGVT